MVLYLVEKPDMTKLWGEEDPYKSDQFHQSERKKIIRRFLIEETWTAVYIKNKRKIEIDEEILELSRTLISEDQEKLDSLWQNNDDHFEK